MRSRYRHFIHAFLFPACIAGLAGLATVVFAQSSDSQMSLALEGDFQKSGMEMVVCVDFLLMRDYPDLSIAISIMDERYEKSNIVTAAPQGDSAVDL